METRAARGDLGRLPGLAAELVRADPDLLYCMEAPDVCRESTSTIPIVFAQVSDPVRFGLVESLARPGGNVTGIASLRIDLTAKRLELFKALVPSLRRVLVTYDRSAPEERQAVRFARAAAARLGLALVERTITTPLEMEPGLAALAPGGRDGILVVQVGSNLNIAGRSLEVATSRGLPAIYPNSAWASWGALASYGADAHRQGRQAARLAHKILGGTRPGDLPVELPDHVELVVNAATARRLGLAIPRAMLLRADRVIDHDVSGQRRTSP